MKNEHTLLGYFVGNLSLSIRKSFDSLFADHNIDLTKEQWVVLKGLINNGPLTQTQITQFSHKDKTTITRAIDSLAKNEYVVRTTCPEDRRVHIVKLTENGRKIMEYMAPFIEERMREAVSFIDRRRV